MLPRILELPANVTLFVGSTFNVTCKVSGDPHPDVIWSKDGIKNLTGADYHHSNTQLIITSVTVSDEGVYMCNASSRAGWMTSIVTLRIQGTTCMSFYYIRSQDL